MNYAVIEDGIVTNIIWLYPGNADEFPNAINISDRPVGIGDTYVDGKFYRDGQAVLTSAEHAAELEAALAEIGEALNE